jgi:diacylglycerol kinase family enzyme
MGPEVVQRMERSAPVFGPAFHYFSNIVKGFLTYKKKSVICTGRVWKWEGRLLQMAVANGRYFGNGLCATPDADLTDGKFHVAIFGELTLWDYLKNLGNLKNGRKITHPQVSYYTTQVLRIESEEECGIEADGEFVGMAPVTVRVLPGSLRFLVPPDS